MENLIVNKYNLPNAVVTADGFATFAGLMVTAATARRRLCWSAGATLVLRRTIFVSSYTLTVVKAILGICAVLTLAHDGHCLVTGFLALTPRALDKVTDDLGQGLVLLLSIELNSLQSARRTF
jgi:hypothetical protein